MDRKVVLARDPLSSGGSVLTDNGSRVRVNGIPVAGIGACAWCAVCKSIGSFARTGGPFRRSVFGVEEALEDDIVLCRCAVAPRLIALAVTQRRPHCFVDDRRETMGVIPPPVRQFINLAPIRRLRPMQAHSIQFSVTNQTTGEVLANTSYRIILDNNVEYIGVTDARGLTEIVGNDSPFTAKIEAPYYDGQREKPFIHADGGLADTDTDTDSCCH